MNTGKHLLNLSPHTPSAWSLIPVTRCRMSSPYLFHSPKVRSCSLPEACLPHSIPTHSPLSPGKPPHLGSHCYTTFSHEERTEKPGLNSDTWSLPTSIRSELSFLLCDPAGSKNKHPLSPQKYEDTSSLVDGAIQGRSWNFKEVESC